MTVDLSAWEEVGLDPFSPPPEGFDGLSMDEAVELIRQWFFDNFEDPVHSVPYNSREGGYLYVWGPYNARDIIENVFADTASDELIDAAINSVEAEGYEWVPSMRRIQYEAHDDEMGADVPASNPTDLHKTMITRLEALEAAMAALPSAPAGLGHNHPPEPIEDDPLTPAELEELRTAVTVLQSQPPEPTQSPPEAKKAAQVLASAGTKLGKYLAAKGDLFVTEVVKAAGSETGKLLVKLPIWAAILTALSAASGAVSAWLHSIVPF